MSVLFRPRGLADEKHFGNLRTIAEDEVGRGFFQRATVKIGYDGPEFGKTGSTTGTLIGIGLGRSRRRHALGLARLAIASRLSRRRDSGKAIRG